MSNSRELFAGRYREIRRLGQGGMGEVWLALDLATGTECAIKHAPAGAKPGLAAALRSEFEALARLRHPSLVRVRDLGFTPEGEPFLVMNFVPGLHANEALETTHWPSVVWFAARVARGLEALHSAGIVHGDLKPANVLVIPAATPRTIPTALCIVDLGLSVITGRDRQGNAGTMAYAAPEVLRGQAPSPSSDLYSLGATLFAMITGEPVGARPSSSSTGMSANERTPDASALEASQAPKALVRLILRLLGQTPAERPALAAEVAIEWEALSPHPGDALDERLRGEVFLGRERELARLSAGARASRGAAFLVTGPAGVGRSALLQQAAVRATVAGRRVARAEASGLVRGSAAVALARGVAAAAGADLLALPADLRALLAGERDELSEALEEPLLDALPRWLVAIAERSGAALLLVDDVDALDEAGRAWLRRALVRTAALRAVWLWSSRSLTGTAEWELVAAGAVQHLSLEPLALAGMQRLVAERLGHRVPEALEPMIAECAGIPGAVLARLRVAVDSGVLREQAGHLLVDAIGLAAMRDPGHDESGRMAAFAALPGDTQAALIALAACDGVADDATLTRMTGAESDLQPALRAGFLRAAEGGRWALTPASVAAPLLAAAPAHERERLLRLALARPSVSDGEQVRLHAAIGEYAQALAVAEHAFANSRDPVRLDQIGDIAEQHGDDAARLRWHQRAIALGRERGDNARVLHHLGMVLAHSRDPRARSAAWAMSVVYEARSGRPADLLERARLARQEPLEPHDAARIDLLLLILADPAPASETIRAALQHRYAITRTCPDADLHSWVCTSLSTELRMLHELEASERFALEALEAARRSGSARSEALAVRALASVMLDRGAYDEARERIGPLLASARAARNHAVVGELLPALFAIELETGDWAEAIRIGDESQALALERGYLPGLFEQLLQTGIVESLRGRSRTARGLARRALRLARRARQLARAGLGRIVAVALRDQGHLVAARRSLERELSLALKRNDGREVLWSRIELARTLAWEGRWSDAVHTLAESAGAPLFSVGDFVAAALHARGLLRFGELDGAEDVLRLAREQLASRPWRYAEAHLFQLAAEIAIVRGNSAAAIVSAADAFERYRTLPAPGDLGRAAFDLVALAMEHSRGDAVPVDAWLEIAREQFEKLGDLRARLRTLEQKNQWFAATIARSGAGSGEQGLLEALSGLLDSLPSLEELARRAVELAATRFAFDRGVVLLEQEVPGEFEVLAEHGAVDALLRESARGFSRTAIDQMKASGDSVFLQGAAAVKNLNSKSMQEMQVRAVAIVPLHAGERPIGCVYLQDSSGGGRLAARDRLVLVGFARMLSAAFTRALGQQKIEAANARLLGENRSLARALRKTPTFDPTDPIIGISPEIQNIRMDIRQAALGTATVLVLGETGTGKELVARELHRLGPRHARPFIAVNSGASVEGLIETNLFGIEAGRATGVSAHLGFFELANGGTIFLDEVGEMSAKLQVALLRVLQERVISRVGGARAIPVDVRVVAATNRDLANEVRLGRFRTDLYYRLAIIPIELPPLRARKGDIPILAHHFAEKIARRQGRAVPQLSRALMTALMKSEWRGNIRGLENYIERLMAMTEGSELKPDPPPRDLGDLEKPAIVATPEHLPEAVANLELGMIQRALEASEGNQSAAAEMLHITEQTLRYRLRKYGITKIRKNRRVRY